MKLHDAVLGKLEGEWDREERSDYVPAASFRTPQMGMTVQPHDRIAVFRMWAPRVSDVFVETVHGDGPPQRTKLRQEVPGIFTSHVKGIDLNDRYRFIIATPEGEVPRLDPWGRAVDRDGTYNLVTGAFSPPEAEFTLPDPQDMVIYQMDPRTFYAKDAQSPYVTVPEKLSQLADAGGDVVELIGARGDDVPSLQHFIREAHRLKVAVLVGLTNHDLVGDCVCGRDAVVRNDDYFYSDVRLRATDAGPRPNFVQREVAELIRENVRLRGRSPTPGEATPARRAESWSCGRRSAWPRSRERSRAT